MFRLEFCSLSLSLTLMAEQSSSSNVLRVMERLWFHQNIMKMPIPISETPPPPSSSTELSQENSQSDEASNPNPIHQPKEREQSPAPTLDNIIEHRCQLLSTMSKTQSCYSPRVSKHPTSRIAKMRSCKSIYELEHEELKGFMDLGFIFNEKELSPYMKSILPGLQMLREKQVATRPYLSETWLINRPDSPLLNLQMPPISAASQTDIKNHLRFWARTVANVIHHES